MHIAIALLTLMVGLLPAIQPATVRAAPQAVSTAAVQSRASVVAEIPIVVERNKTIAPVAAGGASLRLILDTGHASDGILIFSTERVDTSGFGPPTTATIVGAGSGTGSSGLVFERASFSVGGIAFTHQRAIVLTGDRFKGSRTDGVIGYSLFGRYAVELDYDRNVMTLHDSGRFRVKPGWQSLPIYFRNNRIPWIDISIATGDEPLVTLATYIDYASSEALELLDTGANRFGLPATMKNRYLGRGLSGDINGREGRIARLRLGPYELTNVLVAVAPAEVRSRQGNADAVVANNLLRRFNVIFDYAHQKLHIRPNSHFCEPF